MPDVRTATIVIVALAAVLVPVAFLVSVLGAVARRRAGHELGPAWTGTVAFLGGAALGSMFLLANDVIVGLPLAVVAIGVAVGQWRSGRRMLAGLVVAGATLPWTLLWGSYLVVPDVAPFDPVVTAASFLAGAVPTALGLAVAARTLTADRSAGEDVGAAAPTRLRLGRSFHTVGAAMREPSQIGPFGMPELAALIVLVLAGLVLTGLVALGLPPILGYVLAIVVGSALATEAYLRAMAPRTRRSMEAFMWLGDQDIEQIRAATGSGVPTTRAGAAQWLARHPEAPSEPPLVRSVRIELSLLAGRVQDARALVERLPEASAIDRFDKAAAADVVAWWTSRGDALEAMADAAAEILPPDGDDRLRAEVALAVARVRHLAVARPPSADLLAPLLEVRDRLGARAEGITRRILWPRLYRVFVLAAILFAIVGAATGVSAPLV